MLRSLLGGRGRLKDSFRVVKRWLEYEVRVYTGNKRGAGTTANVFVSLKGNLDETDEQYLYGGRFERNSVDRFVIDAPYDLGEIQSIVIGTDRGEDSTGWFLDKVEVNGRPFFCSNWIGRDTSSHFVQVLTPFQVAKAKKSVRSTVASSQALQLVTASYAIPHSEKVLEGTKAVLKKGFGWAGEDAFFTVESNSLNPAMGVADGVYQWRERGIDAGKFSRCLMRNAREIITMVGQTGKLEALDVLRESYARVKEKRVQGSCTACIAILDSSEMLLKSANLGDSGFVVLGEWDSFNRPQDIFHTPPQEHRFGFPYQLGHHSHSSSPDDAELAQVNIREHDLIIMGSDGLLDNVSRSEIMSIVQDVANLNYSDRKGQVREVSFRLANAAYENSKSKNKSTPFSVAASDEFQMVYRGGKEDDITILAGFVQRIAPPPSQKPEQNAHPRNLALGEPGNTDKS
uniref:Protein phosphatase n=1 Tax=Rhodosorus marinus TaxID=101924 RepID=A0A7S2ZIP6_9RHOD|mmetsp:Transcript_20888/g.85044  ORF Transcript_20888/g.85044 Transcript_20888/m.85044 type:complete len:458 (+) Transcript_20888:153-1526(+)